MGLQRNIVHHSHRAQQEPQIARQLPADSRDALEERRLLAASYVLHQAQPHFDGQRFDPKQ